MRKNNKAQPRNAARKHPIITIRVIAKDGDTIMYRNYYDPSGREFTFHATLGVDRAIVEDLKVGEGYQIRQVVDAINTTHWIQAEPIFSSRRLSSNTLIEAIQPRRVVPKASKHFLEELAESWEY
jgi:hypothetical protein